MFHGTFKASQTAVYKNGSSLKKGIISLFLNILLPQLKKLKCIVEGNQKNNERNDLFYNIKPKHLLYENGETTSCPKGDQLFAKQLGHIEITSGHIAACDPFVSFGRRPIVYEEGCSREISYSTCG